MNIKDNRKDYSLYLMSLSKDNKIDLDKNKTYWGNIPISPNYLTCLYDIYKPGMSLIDLGCGAGNVLRFSKNVGYNVIGVEFDKNLISLLKDYSYLNEDITTLDILEYSKYDIIYAYKPLKEEFETYINKVIDNMKKEAYILTPLFNIKNKKVKLISRYLYQKK